MTSEPLPLEHLAKILRTESANAKELLEEIKSDFAAANHGVHLIESSAGWQLRVKPEYVTAVRGLTPYHELSRGLLRVLALIAYKQPITQSEIVKVIGNRTYEYVKALESKGLIRAIKSGRTKALIATKEFAAYFGLESEADFKKFFEQMTAPEGQK